MTKPIIDITDQLALVVGGNADIMQRATTMQRYIDCFKKAQTTLDAGQEAAMTTAQTKSPTAGMTQMLGAGATFQTDVANCAAQFPIK